MLYNILITYIYIYNIIITMTENYTEVQYPGQ